MKGEQDKDEEAEQEEVARCCQALNCSKEMTSVTLRLIAQPSLLKDSELPSSDFIATEPSANKPFAHTHWSTLFPPNLSLLCSWA